MNSKDKERKSVHWFEKLEPEEEGEMKTTPTKKQLQSIRKTLGFEHHIEESYRWVHEVTLALGNENRPDTAYHALRGVLFALRDRMMPQEVFQLSAQLPMHIRGIFFEGYNLKDKPQKYHKKIFLERIEKEMGPDCQHQSEHIFGAVLRVLHAHVSRGELQDIYSTLPRDLQEVWKESLKVSD